MYLPTPYNAEYAQKSAAVTGDAVTLVDLFKKDYNAVIDAILSTFSLLVNIYPIQILYITHKFNYLITNTITDY